MRTTYIIREVERSDILGILLSAPQKYFLLLLTSPVCMKTESNHTKKSSFWNANANHEHISKLKEAIYYVTSRASLLNDFTIFLQISIHLKCICVSMVCFSFRNKRAKQLLFITVFFLILRRVYAFISHFIYSYLLYLWLYFPENLNTKSLSEETMEYLANVNHRII